MPPIASRISGKTRMADSKKTDNTKRIIDVTHADKAAPSGNSKSVIVSNRPLLQDPMVVPEDEAATPKTKIAKSAPELKLKAEPELTETIETTEAPDPAQPETPAEAPETDKDEASKAPADNSQIHAEAEAELEAKRQAHVDELADSKKYYLPIDTIENKRSRRFVALGVMLSLLLIVAWADIALDAGLIQLGSVKPVTHFFSN